MLPTDPVRGRRPVHLGQIQAPPRGRRRVRHPARRFIAMPAARGPSSSTSARCRSRRSRPLAHLRRVPAAGALELGTAQKGAERPGSLHQDAVAACAGVACARHGGLLQSALEALHLSSRCHAGRPTPGALNQTRIRLPVDPAGSWPVRSRGAATGGARPRPRATAGLDAGASAGGGRVAAKRRGSSRPCPRIFGCPLGAEE